MTFIGYISGARTIPSGVTVSVTTNSGGPTAVTVPPGTYESHVDMLAAWVAQLTVTRPVTAGAWTVSDLGAAGASPRLTIGVTAGTFSIAWTSTAFRDHLGFTANITAQTSSTGAAAVRGVWQPDCSLIMDARHESAPRDTDLRQTKGPTGVITSIVGNSRYEHSNLMYSHVPTNKLWRVDETIVNESLQQFLDDTQFGAGDSWFSVGSKCQILAHDGAFVGEEDDVVNWWLTGFRGIREITKRAGDWDGLWSVTFPGMASDGA